MSSTKTMCTNSLPARRIAALQRPVQEEDPQDGVIVRMELELYEIVPEYGQGSLWNVSALMQRISWLEGYIPVRLQEKLDDLRLHYEQQIWPNSLVTVQGIQDDLYNLWRDLSIVGEDVKDVDRGVVRYPVRRAAVALYEYAKGVHHNTIPFPPENRDGGNHDPTAEMAKLANRAFDGADEIRYYPDDVKVNDVSENPTPIQDILQLISDVYSEMADRAADHAYAIDENKDRTDIPQCELVEIAQSHIAQIESINARAADIWPLYRLVTRFEYLD